MLLNNLRTGMRAFRTRRVYYLINILGLALGIASAVLIMLWIADELSYEKMHEKADRIQVLYKQYRMGDKKQVNSSLPYPLAPALEEEMPEITLAVRVVRHDAVISRGEDSYNERNMCAADNNYFEVFSFEFVRGDPRTALTEPYSIVLTEEKAKKYFGDSDPLGQVLRVDRKYDFRVTGVIRDIKRNTSLDYDMIIPFETIYKGTSEEGGWYSHFTNTFIYTEKPVPNDSLDARMTRLMRSHMSTDSKIELLAQPIREMHLHDMESQNSRAAYIYIFSVTGLLIILIACINFTNVSTSLSVKRSKEIGVRKVNGASRRQLVSQFLGETFRQTLAGFLLAMMLVELIRPFFNQMTGKSITIPYLDPVFLLSLAALILLTTLLAGMYPALLISAFNPVDAFRGKITTGRGQAFLRTALLVFQFTISIGLIVSTLAIYGQIRYIREKNMGFTRENLMYVYLDGDLNEKFDTFREQLLAYPQISHVCRSSSLPTSVWNIIRGLEWEGKQDEEPVSFAFLSADEDLIETLGLRVLGGRGFSREFTADSGRYIINEEAARIMGLEDPVGRYFLSDSERIEIIGMINDFNALPLTYRIEPMLMLMAPEYYRFALIRLRPGNITGVLDHVRKTWEKLLPGIPFDYGFVDDRIERQYRSEQRIGKLSGSFTLLAILITCIGLFAIAAHSAQQRTKEIGVRKSMGASAGSVVVRFVTVYLKWVLLANLIALPLAGWIMKRWLGNFAYHGGLNPRIFIFAAGISMVISVLTISWHAWIIARSNPVNSLRYE